MALTKLTQNLIDGTIVTSVNGSSGAVTLETGTDWQTTIQTSNFTAVAGKGYFVNTTSAEITVNLPAGVVGSEIVIQDYAGTFATNKVLLNANGSEKIQGVTDDFKCATDNATITLVYQDATKGWTADNIVSNINQAIVSYLVVAGGAGGGWAYGGGGGAGGYKTNYGGTALNLNLATNYTATIGAGGAARTSSGAIGGNGSNSVFSTITSTGGGGGGSDGTINGGSGGSGGGGSYVAGAAGAGTPGQGNNGGSGSPNVSSGNASAGGGGGAGSAGDNAVDKNAGGNGGAGLSNSITGSAVNYAGGGGGGCGLNSSGSPGSGGIGGGGSGGKNYTGGNATANTGGGAGGGGGSLYYNSGAGGSGIVILRYPNTRTVTIGSGLTGSTATTGSDKVTTLTAGTGNIQFN